MERRLPENTIGVVFLTSILKTHFYGGFNTPPPIHKQLNKENIMFVGDKNKLSREVDIELQIQKEIEIQLQLVKKLKPFENHKCYSLSPEGEVKLAEYSEITCKDITWQQAVNRDYSSFNRKLIIKENHKYCTALNVENAKKRFEKMKVSGDIFDDGRDKLKENHSLKL